MQELVCNLDVTSFRRHLELWELHVDIISRSIRDVVEVLPVGGIREYSMRSFGSPLPGMLVNRMIPGLSNELVRVNVSSESHGDRFSVLQFVAGDCGIEVYAFVKECSHQAVLALIRMLQRHRSPDSQEI